MNRQWQLESGHYAYAPQSHIQVDEHSKKRTHTFVIDSRDRDKTAYPNPFEYTIHFNHSHLKSIGTQHLKSISSASLRSISFPKINKENYFILSIQGLNAKQHGTNSVLNGSFAKCYFDKSSQTQGECKPYTTPVHVHYSSCENIKDLKIQFHSHEGIVDVQSVQDDTNANNNNDVYFELPSSITNCSYSSSINLTDASNAVVGTLSGFRREIEIVYHGVLQTGTDTSGQFYIGNGADKIQIQNLKVDSNGQLSYTLESTLEKNIPTDTHIYKDGVQKSNTSAELKFKILNHGTVNMTSGKKVSDIAKLEYNNLENIYICPAHSFVLELTSCD